MASRNQAPCKMLLVMSIALLICATQAFDPNAKIEIKQGTLQGLTEVIPNAHGPIKAINKYLGVPYATAPTGKLRFAPPQPHKGWNEVYQATHFRSICMQLIHHYNVSIQQAWEGFSETDENISEDCLYLNIYTPQNASNAEKPYPVLAYIHGGGFFAGTPIRVVTPGEYLPLRGIVLVSIQYRLGPFGFFSTGNSVAQEIMECLDQVEALKWIKENIKSFGGDPTRVTLLGESAGGSSVNLHLLSPLSKGLFHRVISESGSDLSPFAFHGESGVTLSSLELVEDLNCAATNKERMLDCLRNKTALQILNTTAYQSQSSFFPVVDQHFLQDSPINLRKAGKFQKLPTIAGFVSDEVDAVEFQYTRWPGDDNNPSNIRRSIIDAFTDYFVVAPTYASLAFQSQHSPTWLYEFRHRSDHSLKQGWEGVAHGDITAYVFGVPLLNASSPHPYTAADRNISDFMVTVYTNFVKFGNTTPEPVYGITWSNFQPNDQA
ncbi:hypothetical protein OS493_030536 [Desmophyllum pertusum]|uniref:Carboxylic ester hydrolase n=1 Tax=Desmophyllum pertusum TaxID=174260 RepID=A0A9W9YJT8_9CNID|nr:hypothetical protein OS493_030536 [Desmophyllum pertusum]